MSSETAIVSTLMIILIITYLMCTIYFLILRIKARDDHVRKRIMTIVAFIFFFIALSKLFHLIVIFLHGSANFTGTLSTEHSIVFTFSQISLYVGIIGILFSFERRMDKFERNYATIISSIAAVIYFIIKYISIFNLDNIALQNSEKIMSYIFNGIVYLFTFILAFMYLNIALKTAGDVKKKSLSVFLGYILLLLSYFVFVLEDLLISAQTIAIVGFVFGMIAVIFLIFGYT